MALLARALSLSSAWVSCTVLLPLISPFAEVYAARGTVQGLATAEMSREMRRICHRAPPLLRWRQFDQGRKAMAAAFTRLGDHMAIAAAGIDLNRPVEAATAA